jgi:hypothetical protein
VRRSRRRDHLPEVRREDPHQPAGQPTAERAGRDLLAVPADGKPTQMVDLHTAIVHRPLSGRYRIARGRS